ncbi:MAG: S-layer homology domain-containing protein [Oscillospiraceae bacterium]|nr:S-layer homology domain-containing protein [Oscillospiraceae bacterium]
MAKAHVRIIISMLCIILLCSGHQQSQAFSGESTFPDTNGHWGEIYIAALAERGMVNGFDDGLFRPDDSITIAEFLTIIISYKYEVPPATGGSAWFTPYIDFALSYNIIENYDVFVANYPMDRHTAARISHLSLQNLFGEDYNDDVSAAQQLRDLDECLECRPYVEQSFVGGIFTGRQDNLFQGEANLTRAEASVIVMRMIEPARRIMPLEFPDAVDETRISPEDAIRLLETEENAVLLDVRPREAHDAFRIPGSISLPLDVLLDSDVEQLFTHDSIIIIYCQTGYRSRRAQENLANLGFIAYDVGSIEQWPFAIEVN